MQCIIEHKCVTFTQLETPVTCQRDGDFCLGTDIDKLWREVPYYFEEVGCGTPQSDPVNRVKNWLARLCVTSSENVWVFVVLERCGLSALPLSCEMLPNEHVWKLCHNDSMC